MCPWVSLAFPEISGDSRSSPEIWTGIPTQATFVSHTRPEVSFDLDQVSRDGDWDPT